MTDQTGPMDPPLITHVGRGEQDSDVAFLGARAALAWLSEDLDSRTLWEVTMTLGSEVRPFLVPVGSAAALCQRLYVGWRCRYREGHSGPCAAVEDKS